MEWKREAFRLSDYRPFPHSAAVSKHKKMRSRLGWTISYKSLYFVHPSLNLIPLFTGMRKRSIAEESVPSTTVGSLRNHDGDGNENGNKAIGLEKQNNNFTRASRFFVHFSAVRCTTTTWNWLISRFVEDRNKRQQFSFSFPELWYSPLEFNSKSVCQHLTN